jgi:hypothetical protein
VAVLLRPFYATALPSLVGPVVGLLWRRHELLFAAPGVLLGGAVSRDGLMLFRFGSKING